MPVRQEMTPFEPKIPEYDERARQWSWTPDLLKSKLRTFPIGTRFVDWAVQQGFQIVNINIPDSDDLFGATIHEYRTIFINGDLSERESNFAIAHELVHVLIPYAGSKNKNDLDIEDAIDEIALGYAKNDSLMKYIKEKIPYFCTLPNSQIASNVISKDPSYHIQFVD